MTLHPMEMARTGPRFKSGGANAIARCWGMAFIPRRLLPLLFLPLAARAQESIGTATLQPDGTLILRLRASGQGGALGDGTLRYPPGHADRDMLIRHVGGLRPGETKPFPPLASPRPPPLR